MKDFSRPNCYAVVTPKMDDEVKEQLRQKGKDAFFGSEKASSRTLPTPSSSQVDCIEYETGQHPRTRLPPSKASQASESTFSCESSKQHTDSSVFQVYQYSSLGQYPIAGQVQVCSQNWAQITTDPWILDTVQGYQLELESTLAQRSPPPGLHLSPQECNLVEREIEKLIQKGAVSPVDQGCQVHLSMSEIPSMTRVAKKNVTWVFGTYYLCQT